MRLPEVASKAPAQMRADAHRSSAALGYLTLQLQLFASVLDAPVLHEGHYLGLHSSVWQAQSFWNAKAAQSQVLRLSGLPPDSLSSSFMSSGPASWGTSLESHDQNRYGSASSLVRATSAVLFTFHSASPPNCSMCNTCFRAYPGALRSEGLPVLLRGTPGDKQIMGTMVTMGSSSSMWVPCRQEAGLCQAVRMLMRSAACVCQHYMARQGRALPMYWSPFAWVVLVTECAQGRRGRSKGSAWELASVAPVDDGSAHVVDVHECFTDHEQDDSEWSLVQVCDQPLPFPVFPYITGIAVGFACDCHVQGVAAGADPLIRGTACLL